MSVAMTRFNETAGVFGVGRTEDEACEPQAGTGV